MDVLTDVLDSLRFRSTLYCRVELGAPWGLQFAPTPVAVFHVIERGAGWLTVDGEAQPFPVCGGDLLVLTNGAGHRLADELDRPPVVTIELGKDAPESPELRCYTGEGGTTVLMCGLFDLEQRRGHPLLSVLPPLLHIKGSNGQTAPWLDSTLRFLASEVRTPSLGRDTLVRRLTDILFIQVVRAWAESEGGQARGWLAAVHDPQIGAALQLVHRFPERAWTVAELAAAVHMSRSAFAAQFATLVGEPPLRYLRRWRMQRAIDLLCHTDAPIAAVGATVGYHSEVAFSQVFKREVGLAPQTFRRQHTARGRETERGRAPVG
jgi:AraC-like DNA-binding protein